MERNRLGSRDSHSGPELPRYMRQPAQARTAYTSAVGAVRNSAGRTGVSRGGAGGSSVPAASRRGASAAGNGAKRKYKVTRAQRLMRLSLVVFGALVLIISGILLLSSFGREAEGLAPPTLDELTQSGEEYRAGIHIAGVDVGGLSVSEAKVKVDKAVSDILSSVSITLGHDNGSWTFTAADLQLQANTQDAMVEAMSASDERSLEAGGLTSFPVTFTPNRSAILNKLYAMASEVNSAPIEPHAVPSLSLDPLSAAFEPKQGRNGLMLNEDATADLIVASIAAGDYQARLAPVFDETEPTMSLDFIMENTKKIASWSTEFRNSSSDVVQQDRCFNIQKAADRINNYVLYPGEEFSFNGWVGPRNKENGWKKANGISRGKEFTLQYGGGICQVSTTLYGALLRANLEITDRRSHSIPSSYADMGLDATVDTSGIDLKFRNNTGAPIYIFAYTVRHSDSRNKYDMVVSIYGKPLPEGVEYKPVSELAQTIAVKDPIYTDDPTIPLGYEKEIVVAREGFVADVYLEKYENKTLVSRDKLYTDKYGGNAGEYLRGTGDRATTPVPEGAKPMPGFDPLPGTAEAHPDSSGDETATAGAPESMGSN